MVDEELREPSEATGTAALRAGWSHGHRDVSGGWLRPTVFGAVNGLVTNASLIAGLGGGGVWAHTVVLSGAAALVAGAFSMGTGEYISVTNQNELVHAEVALERRMLAQFPAAEQEELAGYFRDYGADPETAARMAAAVSPDPGTALRVHTREELGVDHSELPSPLLAGGLSLLAFSLGHCCRCCPTWPGCPRSPPRWASPRWPWSGRDDRGPADRQAAAALGPAPARPRRPGHRRNLHHRLPDRRPRRLNSAERRQVAVATGAAGAGRCRCRGPGSTRTWSLCHEKVPMATVRW